MQLIEPFLALFIAHLIGDFVLQTESMALKKGHVFGWLVLHALELGLITWLLCWRFEVWPVVVVVFLTHLIFDWIKPRLKGHPLQWYVVDQLAHVFTLFLCAIWMMNKLPLTSMPLSSVISPAVQVLLAAYLMILRPLTIGMGLFLKPWQDELQHANGNANSGPEGPITGLTRSSEWIGNLERFFVLTAVLVQQEWLVVGVLIAKAILRAPELFKTDQRRRADYIILGTFGSVGLAFAVGMLANFALGIYSGS
ncbi:MAG: DUF3307 domain-containing protein [Verrucomicrobiae bacterium]|nr:DUF3307 domain-containing protein [Verrucomicrobiae bacterium]